MWAYYAAITFLGIALGMSQPAVQSFLPFLVSLDRLPQAIAWNSTAYRTATIAGPAVGGFLYEFGPARELHALPGASTFIRSSRCGICGFGHARATSAGSTAFERIAEGISYIRRRPIIFGAISLDLFAMFLGGATALLPIYARDILDVGPIGLGFLRTAPSAGAAIVAVVLARRQLQRHAGLWMFACVALFGAATIVFGLSQRFLPVAARAGRGRGRRHGERLCALGDDPARHTRPHARPGGLAEFAVRRRLERAWRIPCRHDRGRCRHGARRRHRRCRRASSWSACGCGCSRRSGGSTVSPTSPCE